MSEALRETMPGSLTIRDLRDTNNRLVKGSDPCAIEMPDGEHQLGLTWGPTQPPKHQQGIYYQKNPSGDFFGPFDPKKNVMIGPHDTPYQDTLGNEVFDYCTVPNNDDRQWYIGLINGFDKHWRFWDSRQWCIVVYMTELGWKKIDIAFDKDTIPLEGYERIQQIKEYTLQWDPVRKVFVGVMTVTGLRSHDRYIKTSPHIFTGYFDEGRLKWKVDPQPFLEPDGGVGQRDKGINVIDQGCLRLDNRTFGPDNDQRVWHWFHQQGGHLPIPGEPNYPSPLGKRGIYVTSWFDHDWVNKETKLLVEPTPNSNHSVHLGGVTMRQLGSGKWQGYIHGDSGQGTQRYVFGVED